MPPLALEPAPFLMSCPTGFLSFVERPDVQKTLFNQLNGANVIVQTRYQTIQTTTNFIVHLNNHNVD